jgi:hypothetical protein
MVHHPKKAKQDKAGALIPVNSTYMLHPTGIISPSGTFEIFLNPSTTKQFGSQRGFRKFLRFFPVDCDSAASICRL